MFGSYRSSDSASGGIGLTRRFAAGGFAAVFAMTLAAPAISDSHGSPVAAASETSESVLDAAFQNRYAVDSNSNIELVMSSASGSKQSRHVHLVTKMIKGRLNSISRLEKPEYLRGMTILSLEKGGGRHDVFAFLPSLGRVRRITTAQKSDAFFGSDITYEDLERRRIEEFDLEPLEPAEHEGEAVYRIRGAMTQKGSYSHVEFIIAQSDRAILVTRFYKRGDERPYRVIVAPRATMLAQEGHVLPTRLIASDELRGTTTEVVIRNLRINPPLDDRLFTVATLEHERKLPSPTD
jgi:hypothetical protein